MPGRRTPNNTGAKRRRGTETPTIPEEENHLYEDSQQAGPLAVLTPVAMSPVTRTVELLPLQRRRDEPGRDQVVVEPNEHVRDTAANQSRATTQTAAAADRATTTGPRVIVVGGGPNMPPPPPELLFMMLGAMHQLHQLQNAVGGEAVNPTEQPDDVPPTDVPAGLDDFLMNLLFMASRHDSRPRGLSTDRIEAVTTISKFKKSSESTVPPEDKESCVICCQDFRTNNNIRTISAEGKCQHTFHKKCVDTWFEENSTCPLCRCNLSEDAAPPAVA